MRANARILHDPAGPTDLDDLDRKLLDLLQEDAARPLHDLGRAVGLSPSAVQRRLTRYRSTGLIAKQVAVLDPEAVTGTVLACVLVTLERESPRHHSSFRERMRAAPEVQQCYDLAGAWDYLAILVYRQHGGLSRGRGSPVPGSPEHQA